MTVVDVISFLRSPVCFVLTGSPVHAGTFVLLYFILYVRYFIETPVAVLMEAKLSFVEPGHRWAHSPSPSKALVFLTRVL